MKLTDGSWRAFLARTLVFCAVMSLGVFVAVRAATARDGVAGGNTRDTLSFAGTLTGNGVVPGSSVDLTFRFHRARMATPPICVVLVRGVPVRENNAIAAEVPIDPEADGGARCPTGMFDGSDVQFDVLVGATEVAMNQAINPVPYARYADRVGTPDCPTGYEKDGAASTATITVCYRVVTFEGGAPSARDEVVKVGVGATAFWVDRFEASVYDRRGASQAMVGVHMLLNGHWRAPEATPPLVTISRAGVSPNGFVNWFQANVLCRAVGKRMLTGDEWLVAGQGTVDSETRCRLNRMSEGTRTTDPAQTCTSLWGAHDMIGNLTEWTAEWHVGVGTGDARSAWPETPSDGFNGDMVTNVSSTTYVPGAASERSVGAAGALRGGSFGDVGGGSGLFSLVLNHSPSYGNRAIGFRCVIPR